MLKQVPLERNIPNKLYLDKPYKTNLWAIKQLLGLSNHKLGEKTGLNYTTIANYDRGDRRMNPEHKCVIENITGYEVTLFYDQDIKQAITEETVTLPKKQTEMVLFKVFNILNAMENLDYCELGSLAHIRELQGFDITSNQLYTYFKQFGMDIE